MDRSQTRAFIKDTVRNTRTAVVTGPAAAVLYGVAVLDDVTTVDLVLPGGARASRKSQWNPHVRYHSAGLDPDQVAQVDGVRVVHVSRALFDIHRYYGHVHGAISLDSARNKWPELTRDHLHTLSAPFAHQRGIKKFRESIDSSQHLMASPLETRARLTLEAAHLPELASLEYQAEFTVHSQYDPPSTYYADALVNGYIICEFDGRMKYQEQFGISAQETIVRERLREHALLSGGFPVIRAHWEDLDPANPDSCAFIHSLRRALATYSRPSTEPRRSISA